MSPALSALEDPLYTTTVVLNTLSQRLWHAISQVGQETQQIPRKNKITSSSGRLFKVTTLSTLQDFWDLGRNTLVDFSTVHMDLCSTCIFGCRVEIAYY